MARSETEWRNDHRAEPGPSRGQELAMFLFLTVVLVPVLAVAIVGGYGFMVWIYQLLAGPPGPPIP